MPTSPAKSPRDYTWLIVIAFTLIWALSIHSRAYSSNDASRLAAIDSQVRRGTWAIDDSPLLTVDKIKIGDHFYSDKPPVLSLAGAGLYSILHHALGLTLQSAGCDPLRDPANCRALAETTQADWAYFILTLLLVSSSATLILVLIYRLARHHGFTNSGSVLFIVVLGLGTALWPYSTVFTNHVPAAAAALIGLYVLLTRPALTRGQFILIGFSSALAAAIDPSAGIFAVAYFVLCVWRARSGAGWFLLGAIIPLGLTVLLNLQITGTLLLPQMITSGYNYPGSEFGATVAGNQRAADVVAYIFNLLLGQRGVILFFPIVLWYLWATLRSTRSSEIVLRRTAQLMLLACLIYFLYFALFTDNYGGYSFGPRWLLILMPLLAAFAVTDRALYHPRWRVLLCSSLAVISIYEAYQGAHDPWQPAFPSLRLALTSTAASNSSVALSGYSSLYQLPDDVRERFGSNDVVPRKFDATRTLVIPQGLAWWLVGGRTPLAPEIAQPLGLNWPATVTLQTDLAQPTQDWLTTLGQTASLANGASIDLPITFNDELALLGYQVIHYPDRLDVITAWRVEV
ncbi:MAG TPA: hypothetical protein VMP08_06300, partial [Anaerolineae bacterium]|nr:hypothetical protein [Anaerolineae bacterium]